MDTRDRVKKAIAKYGFEEDAITAKINSAAASVGLTSAYVDVEVKFTMYIILFLNINHIIFAVYW